jgi:hypothetical protein
MLSSFNLLRIKGLYMFRALLTHPQEALNKRHLVYCVRIMSVGVGTVAVEWKVHHVCFVILTLKPVLSECDLHSVLTLHLPNIVYISHLLSHSRYSKSETQFVICWLYYGVKLLAPISNSENGIARPVGCRQVLIQCILMHPIFLKMPPTSTTLRACHAAASYVKNFVHWNIKIKYAAFILNVVYEFVVDQNLW